MECVGAGVLIPTCMHKICKLIPTTSHHNSCQTFGIEVNAKSCVAIYIPVWEIRIQ